MFVSGNTIEETTYPNPGLARNDASKESAINEETGEINWDCPCLKTALAPPCGDFFKEAFSCFVASKTEPKGKDCLEKFTVMQECFRANPHIYMNEDAEQSENSLIPSNEQQTIISYCINFKLKAQLCTIFNCLPFNQIHKGKEVLCHT